MSVPIPAAAAPRSAKSIATMNSGDSEASGASHWTSRNSSMPSRRPVATRLSANGSAAVKMAAPERPEPRDRLGRSLELGGDVMGPSRRTHVEREDGEEDDRIEERQRPLHRNDEG